MDAANGRRGRAPYPPGRLSPVPLSRPGPAVAVAVSLAALALVAASAGSASADGGEQDVRIVYCLGAAHRADLAQAAVRLGLLDAGAGGTVVVPGRDGGRMSLDGWAGRHGAEFARACDALMAADGDSPGEASRGGGGGGLSAFLQSAYLLVAGAVITLLGGYAERISAERRRREQQLTTDLREFRRIACLYLTAYEADPTAGHDEVRRAREALGGTLALVPGRGARRRSAQLLSDSLPLTDRLPASRDGGDLGPRERRTETARVRTQLDRQTREISSLTRPAPARLLDGLLERGRSTAPGGRQE